MKNATTQNETAQKDTTQNEVVLNEAAQNDNAQNVTSNQETTPAKLHGLAGGETPVNADWTIEQNWEQYSAAEHGVWKTLYERQTQLLQNRACDEYLAGLRDLPISAEQIPDFRRLSEVMLKKTGWQIVAVPGLVPDEVFFEHLANRRFPSGQFIRKPEELDYLQEPDVFHDVFGHAPMLMNPIVADFIAAYGRGGLRALSLGMLDKLARVYWYTIEFGLVQSAAGLRIFGAGISSSAGESVYALESARPKRIAFEVERVLRTDFEINHFQDNYFVLDSLDELLSLAQIDFLPYYERIAEQSTLQPGEVLASDTLIQRDQAR